MKNDKLDPRLRFLQDQPAAERAEFMEAMRFGRSSLPRRTANIDILLRCSKTAGARSAKAIEKKLASYSMTVHSVIDGAAVVVEGNIPIDQLANLLEENWIELAEGSKLMFPDLDVSGADVGVRPLQTLSPTVRGNNVLVGIIDGGIDFKHRDFRKPDGTSRIAFLWDQEAASVSGGRVPFGREYTQVEINAALRTTPTPVPINHQDFGGHGTHVAGIAAGSGHESNGQFVGIAPDAELVVVATRGDGVTLGESTSTVAACRYLVDRATELRRPIAINMSLGNNGGGHSGETPLETAMDNLARQSGVVLLKSAGNEQTWRIHASGTLTTNATVRRQFDSSGNNFQQDVFEVWHDAEDKISIAVQPPGGPTPANADFILTGNMNFFDTSAGNRVRIDSLSVDAGGTGDVRAMIFISRGTAPRIQPGRWTIHLRGETIAATGEFHCWIERTARNAGGVEQTRFTPADNDPTCTISIPGTARRVITVGSYVTRFDGDAAIGELSRFSSVGPSRYGLRKPEIAAPGESIISVRSASSDTEVAAPGYTMMPGTSMAAPHVTGAAALLLEVNPAFNCDQVKQILAQAARRNGAAAAAPDDRWGYGRLTVQLAVELARSATFPVVSHVAINATRLSWNTDIPTTGAVRFNSRQRRMALARSLGSRPSLVLGTHHVIDLQSLPAGTYFCEIVAFSQTPDEWSTIDDRQGQHYVVTVP